MVEQHQREGALPASAAPRPGPPPGRRSGWVSRWRTSSSAIRSLSLVTVPGSMPISAARASVLVRLPLWPRAKRHRSWRSRSRRGGAVDGLGVVPGRGPGGRVARVADGQVALEAGEVALVEDVGDQAHVLDDHHLGRRRSPPCRPTPGPGAAGRRGRRRSGGPPAGPAPRRRRPRTLLAARRRVSCVGRHVLHCLTPRGAAVGSVSRPDGSVRAGLRRVRRRPRVPTRGRQGAPPGGAGLRQRQGPARPSTTQTVAAGHAQVGATRYLRTRSRAPHLGRGSDRHAEQHPGRPLAEQGPWSAMPGTRKPTSLRTAISARATPEPPVGDVVDPVDEARRLDEVLRPARAGGRAGPGPGRAAARRDGRAGPPPTGCRPG